MAIASQQKYLTLISWMHRLGVAQKDFSEHFLRSPGKGGQNVNKVETAVSLTYLPTGLNVKCHAQRTQGANRYQAWLLLLTKIEQEQKRQKAAKIAEREKARRQKRGRSAKGKEKMLSNKKINARKKLERSRSFNQLSEE